MGQLPSQEVIENTIGCCCSRSSPSPSPSQASTGNVVLEVVQFPVLLSPALSGTPSSYDTVLIVDNAHYNYCFLIGFRHAVSTVLASDRGTYKEPETRKMISMDGLLELRQWYVCILWRSINKFWANMPIDARMEFCLCSFYHFTRRKRPVWIVGGLGGQTVARRGLRLICILIQNT